MTIVNKIDAIKQLRELAGNDGDVARVGLADAKNFVEAVMAYTETARPYGPVVLSRMEVCDKVADNLRTAHTALSQALVLRGDITLTDGLKLGTEIYKAQTALNRIQVALDNIRSY